MLKAISNSIRLNKNDYLKKFIQIKKLYHSKFDSNCKNIIKLNSLDLDVYSTLNIKNKSIELEYYDSHYFESNLKYKHSSFKTVLILPSSEHELELYDDFIRSLVEENYRVLALRFPGK